MELPVYLLFGFITLNCLLKISLASVKQGMIWALSCAAFVWSMWSVAAEQPQAQIAGSLASSQQMQEAAVWIILEALLLIAYCFDALTADRRQATRRQRIVSHLLRLYPGLLIGVVLFYLLTQCIYAFPGTDFRKVALAMAGITLLAIPLLSGWLRFCLPEPELRLELLFLTSLCTVALGILATGNGQTFYTFANPYDWSSTLCCVGLLLAGFAIGFIWKLIHKK